MLLNSISTFSYMKIALVCAHISLKTKFTFWSDVDNIEINCYNLIGSNHLCVLYSGEVLQLLEIQSA